MIHFHVDPDDVDAGHYGCHRSGDGQNILVQIGERAGGAQTRLALIPTEALRLAADLISAGSGGHDRHARSDRTIDEHRLAWEVVVQCDRVHVGFRDDPRNHEIMGHTVGPGGADRRAQLEMSPRDALMFGRLILARTQQLLDMVHGDPWTLGG